MVAVTLTMLSALACGPLAFNQVEPTQVGLQARDVSAEFKPCGPPSDIETYLKRLPITSPWRSQLSSGWKQLQGEGADASAATEFATGSDSCTAEPGSSSSRSVSSVVARFSDDGAAQRAFQVGVFGFPTPGEDQLEPGLRQGVGTQLGAHSWLRQRTVDNRNISVALWQSHQFCIFVLAWALDSVELQRALVAIDGRAG
ncbi:MAG: hypothetical protein DLM66_12925 [Candidatus Dormiibacter spiritus]|nr:MAG: hypothetical protein DLM66_12925 [Candidatus Dormibacteraeota bacterium]